MIGSLLAVCLPRVLRKCLTVALPLLSFWHLVGGLPLGTLSDFWWFGQVLHPVRVDQLSLVWASLFHFAAFVAAIYGWQENDRWHDAAAALYAGSAIAATTAGDLLSLFVFWELTAVSSALLVWRGSSPGRANAGLRYLLWQVGSGVLLLSGLLLHLAESGSLAFGGLDESGVLRGARLSSLLILIGIGIKAAFPLVHCWLPDAYPRATPAGTVYLSSFTTKMAIYALIRGFAGTESLIWIGTAMALFPLWFAAVEDDLRKVLAHLLNSQLGFMVVAAGIGTPLAIDGAAAMAVAHVIYKGLLFMALGAVLRAAGTARASQLGGLVRRMPWTFAFGAVGSLAACPPGCAFVTKSLVMSAVAQRYADRPQPMMHYVWLGLTVGAAGALLGSLKVLCFAFAGPARDEQAECPEAPRAMRLAMAISATACLLIGLLPAVLYRQLPHRSDYHPYSAEHLLTQLQMVTSVALAFALLVRWNWWPRADHCLVLDVDWLWRRPLRRLVQGMLRGLSSFHDRGTKLAASISGPIAARCEQLHCELGPLGRTVSSDRMVLAATILLLVYLWMFYR